jgi:hypothetical protein
MVDALNVMMVKFLTILGVAISHAHLIMYLTEKTVFVHLVYINLKDLVANVKKMNTTFHLKRHVHPDVQPTKFGKQILVIAKLAIKE